MARLAARSDGSLGACVLRYGRAACVNGDKRYPLQSVMKLFVAFAAFDAADRGVLALEGERLVRREDLSVYVQPIARRVGPDGFRTTWRDLVRRALVDSDSAATDILLARLGGPAQVQRLLDARGLAGIRIDRDERHLQTEIVGLAWRQEFVDAEVFEQAIARVPVIRRRGAYRAYASDPRDTATPRAMVVFLQRLARGELLTPNSTAALIALLRETQTFPGRLHAGAPIDWSVAHKTGTSSSFEGVTAATNDVGLYFPPNGPALAIAVFLANSRASASKRDAIIAGVGSLASRPAD